MRRNRGSRPSSTAAGVVVSGKIGRKFMFEDNIKRKRIFTKLSAIIPILFFSWGAVQMYSIKNASRAPIERTGKVYARVYKGETYYITGVQYYLTIFLPLAALASIPLLIAITSPKLGLFKYDD